MIKKLISILVVLLLALPVSVLAEKTSKGKGKMMKEFHQKQRIEKQEFMKGLHEEKKDFKKYWKELPKEERHDALKEHLESQKEKRTLFRKERYEEKKAFLKEELEKKDKLKKEEDTSVKDKRSKKNFNIFQDITNDPNLSDEEKKKAIRERLKAERDEDRKLRIERRRQIKKKIRDSYKD